MRLIHVDGVDGLMGLSDEMIVQVQLLRDYHSHFTFCRLFNELLVHNRWPFTTLSYSVSLFLMTMF